MCILKYSENSSGVEETVFPIVLLLLFLAPLYLQHGNQLRLWDAHPVTVAAVNNIDDCICVWVITPPVGPTEQRGWRGEREAPSMMQRGMRKQETRLKIDYFFLKAADYMEGSGVNGLNLKTHLL